MFIELISNEYSNSEIDRSRVNLKMENKVSKSEIENKVSEIGAELTLMHNTSGVQYFVQDFDSALASDKNLYQCVLVEGVLPKIRSFIKAFSKDDKVACDKILDKLYDKLVYEVQIEQLTRFIIPFFFENVLIEASRYGVIKCLDWANSPFCVARVMGNPVRNGYVFEKMAQAASENGHIAVFEWINNVVSTPRPPADPSKYAKYNFFNLEAIKNICRLDISCIQWLKEKRGEKFLDHWFEFSYVCIDKKSEAYNKFKEELMKVAKGDTVAFLSDHFYED